MSELNFIESELMIAKTVDLSQIEQVLELQPNALENIIR